MKISDVPRHKFVSLAANPGVWLRTGPFEIHLQTRIEPVARTIHLLYSDFPVRSGEFADFHIRLDQSFGIRRWYRPQVFFRFDDRTPFAPLPLSHAYAMFEWGLNWCIETYSHHYLIIHAAILERAGRAAILAAPPGSGKSTLTAALSARGWRLLSDELTLINPEDGTLIPIARPVALKNESIEIIRKFVPDRAMGPIAFETVKGSVAHLQPPADSVERMEEPALPSWVIFPRFEAGSDAALTPYPKGQALLRLGDNAFNYSHFRKRGFQLLCDLIDRSACYEFVYSRLEDAITTFESLSSPALTPEKIYQ